MKTDQPLKVIAGTPDRPLRIGDIEIQAYVLEDETRVLSQRGFFSSVNATRGGPRNPSDLGAQTPRFASQNWLKPYIPNDLLVALTSPLPLRIGNGPTAFGYTATLLVDLCDAIMEAEKSGMTTERQRPIVDRATTLIRGFATIGIIALVDEATGYQRIREELALATILEKFIATKLHPWTKTFPYSFYEELCRLKRWPGWYAVKRPHVIADYTNEFVYSRIAPGVLREVQRLNPINPQTGERLVKHHQWFSEDNGHPRLREHIAAVTALMRASANWGAFKRNLVRAFPAKYDNQTFPFMDDEG